MKKIKYLIGNKEDIGNILYNSIILNAYLVHEDDYEGLIYFPANIEYQSEKGEKGKDNGCGCLSFGRRSILGGFWERSPLDYLNLSRQNPWQRKIRR